MEAGQPTAYPAIVANVNEKVLKKILVIFPVPKRIMELIYRTWLTW